MHQWAKLKAGAIALALAVGLLGAQVAAAHHGWAWTSDEEFELTGKIVAVRLGNPHGELSVEADGQRWIVEVGQPWRNEQAGLRDDLLSIGRELTAHGHRSSDPDQHLMKAERIVIEGKSYNLYPDRAS